MRNAISMILLAIASSSAAAEWLPIGSHEEFTYYANPATIRTADNRVEMLDLYDYNTFRAIPMVRALVPYKSKTRQVEYDCKEGQARLRHFYYYEKNMGGGIVRDLSAYHKSGRRHFYYYEENIGGGNKARDLSTYDKGGHFREELTGYGEWAPVPSHTPAEDLWKFACGKK